MKSCKLCWGISLLLAVAVVGMGYSFLIRGTVEEGDDGRTAVLLAPAEKIRVLGEMRAMLEAVHAITIAISENDMETIASEATAVGMAAARAESPAMLAKLPLDFKALGMSTHQAFDDLAQEAIDMGDGAVVLTRLSGVLEKCTACHAGYQLREETE